MIVFPHCKINVGLDVLRRRSDGYHDIETFMVPVRGFYDVLEIVRNEGDRADFTVSGLTPDCGTQDNLCIKAYELMASVYGLGGVRIHLHKVIPSGAGLGGGSSDAAFTIRCLDGLFDLGLSMETMESLAAGLGSDTAFFIRSEPRMSSGRGDVLSPCGVSLTGRRLVIVKPPVAVSTAEAYGSITPSTPERPLSERLSGDMANWRYTVHNRFEDCVFGRYPVLAQIKERLYSLGAVYASMSGSGSAIYGIFDEPEKNNGYHCQSDTYPFPAWITEALRNEFGNELFVFQQIMP